MNSEEVPGRLYTHLKHQIHIIRHLKLSEGMPAIWIITPVVLYTLSNCNTFFTVSLYLIDKHLCEAKLSLLLFTDLFKCIYDPNKDLFLVHW